MVAERIIDELEKRFPTVDVMDALGILYPQYWTSLTTVNTFLQHPLERNLLHIDTN
jgi:hypothetical protein